jgi:hypothetical protein
MRPEQDAIGPKSYSQPLHVNIPRTHNANGSIFGEAGNIGYSFPTTLTRAKETTKAQNAHSSSSVKVYEVFSKDECTIDRPMPLPV